MERFTWDIGRLFLLLGAFLVVVSAARASRVPLAYECARGNSPTVDRLPVVMVHGLSDYKETWDGVSQPIIARTGRRVCMYDARNHGDSGWSDTFNVDALADDLGEFMKDRNIDKASLVGHSMGGLTVLKYALKYPDQVESVFIEDIAPSTINAAVGKDIRETFTLLQKSLSAIPDDADDETAVQAVKDYVMEATNEPPKEYLFKRFPFTKCNGTWHWVSNFPVFIEAFKDPAKWLGEVKGVYNGSSCVICGKESPFKIYDAKDELLTYLPQTCFIEVEGAGHLIHPHSFKFLNEVIKFLNAE